MDKRKDFLSTAKLCRFCLTQDEPLKSLYVKKQSSKKSIPLSLKVLSTVSIQVFPSDRMPSYICNRCNFFMDLSFQYKQMCRDADETTIQYIQSGSALEPVVWPPSLVKLFRYGVKQSETGVVKTVVEGGATVEVTSHDASDSEDDDENVYNVKIGDGTEEGTSTCVKVVTSKDQDSKSKINKKDVKDGGAAKLAGSAVADGCWPCNECDCTYPLQQLLELHKMQKHRERNVACDQCDAKFFSKYDLTAHRLRHSNETPFECVACDKRFKRLILLKRHERLTHPDLPQHKCSDCPASFLSLEEFEIHQLRHRKLRRYSCTECSKRFYDKGSLQRHTNAMHMDRDILACEYCPERFPSVAKLARHVRSHAGVKPYPCKYCDKSFTKSHHYTRHVRVKHNDENNSGTFGVSEDYRCDQCNAAFATQDELIYHSAIHATQNLTCPLCQEKFENVDAVTTHIKSHVSGMEFMCALCELVFTSKEKLENHFVSAHDEEIRNAEEMGQVASWYESDAQEEDDDDDDDNNSINVKDAGDHMVVEIKKPDDFMLSNDKDEEEEDKTNHTVSEESEPESAITELPAAMLRDTPTRLEKLPSLPPTPPVVPVQPVAKPATPPQPSPEPTPQVTPQPTQLPTPAPAIPTPPKMPADKSAKINTNQATTIVFKAEDIKRKIGPTIETVVPAKKEKTKAESSSAGASDKSLRLLEKELQELQRTNTRYECPKTPAKSLETLRSSRRPQIHTSTPKPRSIEERRQLLLAKSAVIEKKIPERRGVKENKKPEESKETKTNNVSAKEEKEPKSKEEKANVSTKEDSKDKSLVKNGASNKSSSEDAVRRSSRPSKVKDYAKMIRDRTDVTTPSDDDSDDDDEEYMNDEKLSEAPKKARRVVKIAPKPAQVPGKPVRKRGRPRKTLPQEIPAKVRKDDTEDSDELKFENEAEDTSKSEKIAVPKAAKVNPVEADASKQVVEEKQPNLIVAPTGHTLKKVPMRSLPPGVKPLPLPANARSMGAGELCEMQIGKKVVKVQKIVMTKAEVEAMAKKGLVEMKDGTMVLKQGIKIPTDPGAFKSTLVGEDVKKESPKKTEKAAPTRCELGGT